jgi:hypothetical protein
VPEDLWGVWHDSSTDDGCTDSLGHRSTNGNHDTNTVVVQGIECHDRELRPALVVSRRILEL